MKEDRTVSSRKPAGSVDAAAGNGDTAPESVFSGLGFEQKFNRKRIFAGLRYFLLLTVIGFTVLFVMNSTGETVTALGHLEGKFILIACLLSAFDLWIGGFRNHIFVREVVNVSQKLCFRANIANLFLGAVTPSQSGGGPAQMFVLYRGGVPFPAIISVSVINFMATLVFFLISASFALVVVRDRFSQDVVSYLVQYGFVLFALLFAFFAFALWRPDLLGRAVYAIARLVGRRSERFGERIVKLGYLATSEIQGYHETCTRFVREKPHLLVASFVLTIVMYVNKFLLAYFVMRGLGVDGDLLTMLAIQTIIMFILYFSPSPGGSGIAELSIAALMASMMPAYLLPIFTLLQRFFLLYLPALLGFFVITGELRKGSGAAPLQ